MADGGGTIGRGLRVQGEITGEGTLSVEGEVRGTVTTDRIDIRPDGIVEADVSVDEALVAGRTAGQLNARRRLEIRATAQIEGDVHAASLVIEDGARVKGRVHMDTGIED